MSSRSPLHPQRFLAAIVAVAMLIISAPVRADDDPQARARLLNDQGNAAYELGNYDEAIDRFSGAYKAYPDAWILFNLAQAYRKKQAYDRALDLYRNYLHNFPNAPNQRAVEELIAELESLLAKQRAADSQPPHGTATTSALSQTPTIVTKIEEPRPWYSNSAGWWLVGGGVIATGVGVGLFISTRSLEDQLAMAPDPDKAGIRSDISSRRTVATVLSVVGGLAIAGGIVIFAVSPRTVTREVVPIKDLKLSIAPTAIGFSGTF